jgi:hypothetical protein
MLNYRKDQTGLFIISNKQSIYFCRRLQRTQSGTSLAHKSPSLKMQLCRHIQYRTVIIKSKISLFSNPNKLRFLTTFFFKKQI